MTTIFSKIISGEISADIVYKTPKIIAFKDIFPQAPTHILVVPAVPYENILEADSDTIVELFAVIKHLVSSLGLEKGGFRVVINTGDEGGQTVPHLHLHLLAGRDMKWPPG